MSKYVYNTVLKITQKESGSESHTLSTAALYMSVHVWSMSEHACKHISLPPFCISECEALLLINYFIKYWKLTIDLCLSSLSFGELLSILIIE